MISPGQLKYLEETLGWYADLEHYRDTQPVPHRPGFTGTSIAIDAGNRARWALLILDKDPDIEP